MFSLEQKMSYKLNIKNHILIQFIEAMPLPEKATAHFNILDQHSDFNSGFEISKHDDFKNEYSTFIEQLQQTTEKLINEVFNVQYKPDVIDDWDAQQTINPSNQKSNRKQDMYHNGKGSFMTSRKKETGIEGSQSFKNFITRNNKWCDRKNNHLKKEAKKKQQIEFKELTLIPQILRGSREKLQPIYERASEIHASKEKKRTFRRIEQKRKQDQQLNKYTFHPEINEKSKPRTLQEYLQDKQDWQKKKNEVREIQRLKQEAKKYVECSFTPNLVAKQIEEKTLRSRPGEKVQQRLLRSLEKAFSEV